MMMMMMMVSDAFLYNLTSTITPCGTRKHEEPTLFSEKRYSRQRQ